MIDKIISFAKDWHQNNRDGHGFDHVFRVYKLAKLILQDYPTADEQIVLTAALLHDTYDDKLVNDVLAAKTKVADFLKTIGFTNQDAVFEIIDHLSFSSEIEGGKPVLTLEGNIVQDADRLDAIGAFGITRTLQYGFARQRKLYDPAIQPKTYQTKSAYHACDSTTLNHFYEKLFKLSDTLHTDTAKKMAIPRDKLMRDFVNAIESEYNDVYGN